MTFNPLGVSFITFAFFLLALWPHHSSSSSSSSAFQNLFPSLSLMTIIKGEKGKEDQMRLGQYWNSTSSDLTASKIPNTFFSFFSYSHEITYTSLVFSILNQNYTLPEPLTPKSSKLAEIFFA
ncbi:unnamed protein product [Citrullus colocynthis]|uniref:Uncharacterized protein n=1 Tax=Citrullus colocynthis TaxID=252529 RepID=A0ABP0YD14_9ROSI